LKEIGATAGLSRQRIRKLVSELELKGLVSTSKSEAADKRVRVISALPLAAKVLSLISTQMQELLPEASESKRGNSFARAARALEKVAKGMRRKLRNKGSKAKKADRDIDLDDDED
jgi:DNA-binding MarR family transcriptional regulator